MYETFCENCSHFLLKWFHSNSLGEVCFYGGELWKYAKSSNFENFENALYLTSGSMPLIDLWFSKLTACAYPWFPLEQTWLQSTFVRVLYLQHVPIFKVKVQLNIFPLISSVNPVVVHLEGGSHIDMVYRINVPAFWGTFSAKFGIVIGGFHQRRRSPKYINWVYFGQIIVKSTQVGRNIDCYVWRWVIVPRIWSDRSAWSLHTIIIAWFTAR